MVYSAAHTCAIRAAWQRKPGLCMALGCGSALDFAALDCEATFARGFDAPPEQYALRAFAVRGGGGAVSLE